MAVRFQYEWHDTSGNRYRSYGNELWEFDQRGLMLRREASINDNPLLKVIASSSGTLPVPDQRITLGLLTFGSYFLWFIRSSIMKWMTALNRQLMSLSWFLAFTGISLAGEPDEPTDKLPMSSYDQVTSVLLGQTTFCQANGD